MVLQHIGWPTGDDRIYEIEVLLPDGKAPTDPTKGVQDVTGFTLAWVMCAAPDLTGTPLIEKRTASGGITISGIYHPDRMENQQRVRIRLDDTDTDTIAAGTYYHALKRLDAGLESTGVQGKVKLVTTAAPAA